TFPPRRASSRGTPPPFPRHRGGARLRSRRAFSAPVETRRSSPHRLPRDRARVLTSRAASGTGPKKPHFRPFAKGYEMSLKRFGFPSLAVLLSLAIAGSAFAKDKKKEKDEGPDKKGGMMEEGGKDPALTETAEEGEFTPGKHKKEHKAAAEGEIGASASTEG